MRLQDTSIVEAKLSSRGSTSVANMHQTLSCMSTLSSGGSVRLRYSYIVRQSLMYSAAPCLLRRLAILDWLDLAF
ncbi:hypothetical protein Tco_1075867 [Tanacetum coccineum]